MRGGKRKRRCWSVGRGCRLSSGKDREVGYRTIGLLVLGSSDAVELRRRGLSCLGVRCQDAKTLKTLSQIPAA